MKFRFTLTVMVLLLSALLASGCRQSAQPTATPANAADDVQINLKIDPDPAKVGDASLFITLTDAAGNSVDAQEITVHGDMTHAGMMPVTGETAVKTDDGSGYRVPLKWSMAGDWIVTVEATLTDGTKITHEFNLTVAAS